MQNCVKKLLSLSLLAIALSSCSGQHSVADKVSLNYHHLSLFEGEKANLVASTLPRSPYSAELIYESSNNDVVSVNDKGEVSAKKAGDAVIFVTDKTSGVSQSLSVSVEKDELSRGDSKKAAKVITDYQTAHSMKCKKVYAKEKFSYTRSKNDILQSSTYYDQDMIVSVDDAYFYIASDDENIKVEGGSKEYSSSAWYIYTSESFDTYLFHIDGITKNYMVCDTTSYISSGGTRYDALCEVLDNLFTSGKKMIVNTLADAIGKDNLDRASTSDKSGSRGDGYLMYESSNTGKGTADKEDEDDLAIPVGTSYDISIVSRFTWEEYLCVSQNIIQEQIFDLNDDHYIDHYDINYEYISSDFELEYPNRDLFTKVDNIFDL